MTVLCIIIAALAITVIALIMHIQFLKIEVKYAKDLSKINEKAYKEEQEAFKDMSNGEVFITRSCATTRETIEVDGVEYPVVKVEISNTSHPFYTGKTKIVDSAGRVDQFYQRYKARKK